MGYFCRHAIVVSSWSREDIYQARAEALRLGMDVSSPVESSSNNEASFFIAPDGSKEGWPESAKGDQRRDAFVEWLRRGPAEGHYYAWVEVQYGDEDGNTCVLRSSDHDAREKSE